MKTYTPEQRIEDDAAQAWNEYVRKNPILAAFSRSGLSYLSQAFMTGYVTGRRDQKESSL